MVICPSAMVKLNSVGSPVQRSGADRQPGMSTRWTAPYSAYASSSRKSARDVKQGGFLWLSAFGDVVFNAGIASQARIDVLAATEGMVLKGLKGCAVADWSKPVGGRLTGSSDDLKPAEWRDFEYSFVADRDGEVSVELMGRQQLSPADDSWIPVWVYWDEMSGEGAELVNGGFEDRDAKGAPAGWSHSLGQSFVVVDEKVAFAGSRCAKTWHNGRFTQKLAVKAGVPVVIRAKVRGE